MSEPIPFLSAVDKAKAEINESMIDLLSRSLDEAREGKLVAILLVRIDQAGNFNQRLEGDMKLSQAVGLLEIAKHDLLQREHQRPDIVDDPPG